MGPNEKQKIDIENLRRAPLPPLNQAVTADYSDFLGTALIWRPPFERQRDFNPPEQRAAQHTFPGCRQYPGSFLFGIIGRDT